MGDGDMGTIARLLLLAILVLTPLALRLVAAPDRAGNHSILYRAVSWLHFPAGMIAAASFFVSDVRISALLAAGWLCFGLGVALVGLGRLLSRGIVRPEEACINVGLLYLPVGGGWLILSRLGVNPLGFGDMIVLLTAVHFHFAAFLALVIAGLTGRVIASRRPALRRLYPWVCFGLVLGPALVAVGITLSPLVEMVAVAVLVTSLVLVAACILAIIPAMPGRLAQTLLFLSAFSIGAGMVFAFAYGLGEFTGVPLVTISRMVQVHGWLNALGFSLCGLLAFSQFRPAAKNSPAGIPFSRLASSGRVGPGFFQANRVVSDAASVVRGLVDNLDEYQRPDFPTKEIHPAIRSFYESTDQHGLLVRPEWRRGFRLAARLYKRFSRAIGQMNLPLTAETGEDRIESAIIPLKDSKDGRVNVRGWIRTYSNTGEAVYVAAYAHHSFESQTYMNIAFPLPGGNLTSILRLEAMSGPPGARGIVLTTFATREFTGDEGVYLALFSARLRLPFNETIRVWAPSMLDVPPELRAQDGGGVTVVARHQVWLFGIKFLTLDYFIFPTKVTGKA